MPVDQRVSIRPKEAADLDVLFEFQREPEGAAMAAFPSRDRDAYFAHHAKISSDPANYLRTIVVDGEVAGDIGSWQQEDKRLVGYWVGRAYWGRGVATAAVRLFLDEVTERPLFGFVAVHNVGSIRVLEKCGFHRLEPKEGESPVGDDGVEEVVLVLDD
ncbi:MAG: hypothetical protein QOJ60_192 [Actinomycetota bacterium]|jgi:RimJ/RimL family protein N-acetyltransferase|nr:hypothetical protein [Actinomycetota bacterium]